MGAFVEHEILDAGGVLMGAICGIREKGSRIIGVLHKLGCNAYQGPRYDIDAL